MPVSRVGSKTYGAGRESWKKSIPIYGKHERVNTEFPNSRSKILYYYYNGEMVNPGIVRWIGNKRALFPGNRL